MAISALVAIDDQAGDGWATTVDAGATPGRRPP